MNITNRLGQKMRELPQGVGYTLEKWRELPQGAHPLEKNGESYAGGPIDLPQPPLQKKCDSYRSGGARLHPWNKKARATADPPPPLEKLRELPQGGPTPLEKMARTYRRVHRHTMS